jgi:hypothetical protein
MATMENTWTGTYAHGGRGESRLPREPRPWTSRDGPRYQDEVDRTLEVREVAIISAVRDLVARRPTCPRFPVNRRNQIGRCLSFVHKIFDLVQVTPIPFARSAAKRTCVPVHVLSPYKKL